MLVLSRKKNESVRYEIPPSQFPTVILVCVGEIIGNRVRIYSDCPRDVSVVRSEVHAAAVASKAKEVK